MDAYQPPSSDLTIDNKRPFKPVKAVLYGLSIAFFLTTIVSTIVFVALGIINGVDMGIRYFCLLISRLRVGSFILPAV